MFVQQSLISSRSQLLPNIMWATPCRILTIANFFFGVVVSDGFQLLSFTAVVIGNFTLLYVPLYFVLVLLFFFLLLLLFWGDLILCTPWWLLQHFSFIGKQTFVEDFSWHFQVTNNNCSFLMMTQAWKSSLFAWKRIAQLKNRGSVFMAERSIEEKKLWRPVEGVVQILRFWIREGLLRMVCCSQYIH